MSNFINNNRQAPYENIRQSSRISKNPVISYNKKLASEISSQKALQELEKEQKLPKLTNKSYKT